MVLFWTFFKHAVLPLLVMHFLTICTLWAYYCLLLKLCFMFIGCMCTYAYNLAFERSAKRWPLTLFELAVLTLNWLIFHKDLGLKFNWSPWNKSPDKFLRSVPLGHCNATRWIPCSSLPMLVYTCANMCFKKKWLGRHTGCQEFSRCCISDNLRNQLHSGDKTHKQGVYLKFES